ncbi:PR domain zinc finger protein 2 [Drosophila ananassae]|uniref:PR domain zinc finger protein 2 n=1 Tax=Drosophila ananassae TaxID=7217 RepID=UPI000177ED8B|nr:PR domain zinc finger protein 2 [Drosophila ananassae]
MRSLFSNRYNNSRQEFYERYEAARILHPNLPLCERPLQPAQQQIVDCSTRRRYKSYRELANQTREQLESEAWLASDRLPIVVRRSIETRTNKVLMPRYDPSSATHEFSHNGRPRRRGRRPAASTIAKIASDFAKQVGGMPPSRSPSPHHEGDPLQLDTDEANKEKLNFMPLDDSPTSSSSSPSSVESPSPLSVSTSSSPSSASSSSSADAAPNSQEQVLEPKVKAKRGRRPKEGFPVYGTGDIDDENKENVPPKMGNDQDGDNPRSRSSIGRIFMCPVPACKQHFALRRSLYKHQREAGHHNWSHKCEKCGQIFRTAGFKRMHAEGACERNLLKQKLKTK